MESERFADLHLHSTASDGSDEPQVVVRRAAEAGFAVIALSDHDTMAGVPAAAIEAQRVGIELIPAVECSTVDGSMEVHLLAYGLDAENQQVQSALDNLRSGRWRRAQRMVQNLTALGVPITWERVQEIAGHDNVGRPHIARAMQEVGCIETIADAFTPDYIGTGGRAYVPRQRWETTAAIGQIRQWGGVPVIAHPGRSGDGLAGISEDDVARYVKAGMQGLEVFYPRHDDDQISFYLSLAQRYQLLVTGGSDDHGGLSDHQLLGTIRLPYHYVEQLKSAMKRG